MTPDHILATELWTDHEFYERGEPVHIHARVTNNSEQEITLRSPSEAVPVVDIVIERGPALTPIELRVWSQEQPDEVVYSRILRAGESYEVEWTVQFSQADGYSVDMTWLDHFGYTRHTLFGIYYDVNLPG